MCFGTIPSRELVKAFEVSLILYAEHSFNASTFAARVVTSTLSDIYSAVTAAIGALKGPLHGGANEAVMHDMLEIGDPALAEKWLRGKLAEKEKVMGFGHRVYKNGDSRVPTMKKAFLDIADATDGRKWVRMYDILERAMNEATGLAPNLDFPTGPAYYLLGFDIEVFTPIFVMSRITGWTAHIIEQGESNALIRPLSAYIGVPQRSVVA
jgi:citrate synthase